MLCRAIFPLDPSSKSSAVFTAPPPRSPHISIRVAAPSQKSPRSSWSFLERIPCLTMQRFPLRGAKRGRQWTASGSPIPRQPKRTSAASTPPPRPTPRLTTSPIRPLARPMEQQRTAHTATSRSRLNRPIIHASRPPPKSNSGQSRSGPKAAVTMPFAERSTSSHPIPPRRQKPSSTACSDSPCSTEL